MPITVGSNSVSSIIILVAESYPTLCYPMTCSTVGFPAHCHLPELAQTHVHWVGESIQPSYPPPLPPSIFPSIRVFSNESALGIRWSKYWSSSLSISPSNEYSGLISFRMDWLDLLAVQGIKHTIGSINSLVLSLLCSPNLTSIHDCWKNHSFDYTDIFCKVMSLLLNLLSRLVIAFLPGSKYLLISWLQSQSSVIWGPKKIKPAIYLYLRSTCHVLSTRQISFYSLKVKANIAQSRLTLCDPMDYSPRDSPSQNTGVGSLSLLRESFQPRDRTQVSHIAGTSKSCFFPCAVMVCKVRMLFQVLC